MSAGACMWKDCNGAIMTSHCDQGHPSCAKENLPNDSRWQLSLTCLKDSDGVAADTPFM